MMLIWDQFVQAIPNFTFATNNCLLFKNSLRALTAAAVVEKTLNRNKISLLLPQCFYCSKMSFCIRAEVHEGVCSKREATQGGLVNKHDRA